MPSARSTCLARDGLPLVACQLLPDATATGRENRGMKEDTCVRKSNGSDQARIWTKSIMNLDQIKPITQPRPNYPIAATAKGCNGTRFHYHHSRACLFDTIAMCQS